MTPDLFKIPQELKDRPQWVARRRDKIPVDPKTGDNAKADDPDTWGTYAQAVKYYEDHKDNGIAGIGYEFSYYDPYTGMDWDKCRDPETGQLKYCAQVLIDYLDSYGEVSPSGTGIHILLKGKIPIGEGNQKGLNCGGKIETYRVDRYFTVTGHHLEETPLTIQDRDKELKTLHTQVITKPKTPPKKTGPNPIPDISDFALVDKAHNATNGAKFTRLWQGDTTGHGGDDSSADLALCSMLAFYTGPDPGRIDQLFRQSGLMRDKWERQDYRNRTINKALEGMTEFYTPGNGPSSGQKAQEKPQIGIAPPLWPQKVMTGAAGTFAQAYGDYLETPPNFLFMAYLTLLGHVISDRITLKSEITPQPRLYTVLLGESADVRKSTSISKTYNFYKETIAEGDINSVWGAGSGEGLHKSFKVNNRVILLLDEFKAIIQKMRIESSSLLPCITTLFESNIFHNNTKRTTIAIDDGHLCMLAASTLDTYQNMFTGTFTDIGFINRLFILIGDSERKFSIPEQIPQDVKGKLKQDLRNILTFVDAHAGCDPYAFPINSTARDMFDTWYFSLEPSVFAKRLDTYGHRLMILLAANEMEHTITADIAEKTIALLDYQLKVRKLADPIDADSTIARAEATIRRKLTSGVLSKRELERQVNKTRMGIWAWDQAIENLLKDKQIFWDAKNGTYGLIAH